MTIPKESYLTGIWEVSEADRYTAQDAARAYHANRSVCLAKQKKQPIFRICFLVMLLPLFGYFFTEFWQAELNNYMAVISVIYTPLAVLLVLFRKNLRIPAIGSCVYLCEAFRLDDLTALIPTAMPILILGALAYIYEKDRRWLAEQPGFPEFHDILVRVTEEQRLTERNIPAPAEVPEEDPYKGILE